MPRRFVHLCGFCWASPWTLVGLAVGGLSLLFWGRAGRSGRVLEFHGPLIAWVLRRAPLRGGASAITLGHVVLAADHAQLVRTRRHELVHVQQYERWGPLFVPAYFLSSASAWARGADPYFDNAFEQQAFHEADEP